MCTVTKIKIINGRFIKKLFEKCDSIIFLIFDGKNTWIKIRTKNRVDYVPIWLIPSFMNRLYRIISWSATVDYRYFRKSRVSASAFVCYVRESDRLNLWIIYDFLNEKNGKEIMLFFVKVFSFDEILKLLDT